MASIKIASIIKALIYLLHLFLLNQKSNNKCLDGTQIFLGKKLEEDMGLKEVKALFLNFWMIKISKS